MKKATVFLSIIVFGSTLGFSQNAYYSIDRDEFELHDAETRAVFKKAKPNEKIEFTYLNKKGDLKRVTTYQFNENKKNNITIVLDKSGKEKSKRLLTYDGKLLTAKEIYKKGNLKYKTKNTFSDGYNVAYTKFNSKNDILYKRTTTYTDKTYKVIAHKNDTVPFYSWKKALSTISYKKGGIKQANKWVYEYDDNGNRTKSTLYDKKNEIKHVWDYSCKTEGELVKVKNETQQCKWEEMENGMLVEVTRTTSPKGKINKTVKKYDADTNIVELVEYSNDVIIRRGTYDKSFYKTLTWEFYRKGRLKYKQEYAYNKTGEKTGYKSYWGSDLTQAKTEAKYTYKNNKLIAVNVFKKGEPFKTTKITYN